MDDGGVAGMRSGPERLAYSVRETCDLLGLSRGTIDRALRDGLIRYTRIGRRILIPCDAVLEILADAAARRPG